MDTSHDSIFKELRPLKRPACRARLGNARLISQPRLYYTCLPKPLQGLEQIFFSKQLHRFRGGLIQIPRQSGGASGKSKKTLNSFVLASLFWGRPAEKGGLKLGFLPFEGPRGAPAGATPGIGLVPVTVNSCSPTEYLLIREPWLERPRHPRRTADIPHIILSVKRLRHGCPPLSDAAGQLRLAASGTGAKAVRPPARRPELTDGAGRTTCRASREEQMRLRVRGERTTRRPHSGNRRTEMRFPSRNPLGVSRLGLMPSARRRPRWLSPRFRPGEAPPQRSARSGGGMLSGLERGLKDLPWA